MLDGLNHSVSQSFNFVTQKKKSQSKNHFTTDERLWAADVRAAGATHILIGQILIIDEIYRYAHRLSKRVRHNQM